MFTWRHICWLVICVILAAGSVVAFEKKHPPLRTVLRASLVVAALSEACKMAGVIQLVPSKGGEVLLPYLPLNHLPLHFCSVQILLIAYSAFSTDEKRRERVLAFMYPTCFLGGILALLMPSIFTTSIPVERAFTSLVSYQFFLYHTMLMALGIMIARSGEIRWEKRHYFDTVKMVLALGGLSIYVNSLLASPTYVDGELVSVDFWTNFFFTYQNPIGFPITEIWQWYVYLLIIAALAVVLVFLCFYPLVFHGQGKNQTPSSN